MADLIFLIGDIVMICGAAGAVLFALSYAAFFNWRKTAAGRALMYFVWALILVFVNNSAARLFPDYALREWVRLTVYVIVASAIWRLVIVLWRNWNAGTPVLELESRTRKELS